MDYFKELSSHECTPNKVREVHIIGRCETVDSSKCFGTLYDGDEIFHYGGKEWCEPCYNALMRDTTPEEERAF